MPEETENKSLARVSNVLGETAMVPIRRREVAFPDNPAPMPKVDVVTDEDKRFEKAIEKRAVSPTEFIRDSWRARPPLVDGAQVRLDTLLGYLTAMEKILPAESGYPILSSVKLSFEPGDKPKLFIEGGSHSVWTAVAIKAESMLKDGFSVLLPLKRAINVLSAMGIAQKSVVVGVDKGGVCLGSHAVKFGGMLEDFPAQPVMVDPIAKAALPGFYCAEIADRVLPARHRGGIRKPGLQGVLLDFDVHELDGEQAVIGTAVATDGNRMHLLQLPRMLVKTETSRMPPTVRVSPGFFQYLKEIVNSEWTLLELGADQVVAKGEDFIVVAKAAVESKLSPTELGKWRQANITYKGCWMIDRPVLEELVEAAPGKRVKLRLDSLREEIGISSLGEDGTRYEKRDRKHARCFDGPGFVSVTLSREYLLDAIRSCATKMVRMEFDHDLKSQAKSAVVLRGEDEQFKAIVMPIGKED